MQNRIINSEPAMIHRCVGLLENLQSEIHTSIEAITRNSLVEFEVSLWNQEILCGRIRRLADGIVDSQIDKASLHRLSEALAQIKDNSRIYEQVLQRCQRSTLILQDLCSLYAHASRDVRQTNFKALCWEV